MRWVIKSAAESGDGVSIEREQSSTAFKLMPHFVTFDVIPQPEKDSFGSFEPRQAKLLEADRSQGPGDGAHPRFQDINPEASKTVLHANYRPEKAVAQPEGLVIPPYAAPAGLIDPEYDEFASAGPAGLIDPEYDELVCVGPAGLIDPEYDELVSGGKQGFEEIKVTYQANGNFNADALVQQVNGTIGYEMQAGHRSAVRGDDDHEGWNCTCVPDLFTQTFEPVPGMDFAGSFKPVPEDGGFQPLEGASVEIGQPPDPKPWLQMLG
jgi:hypothetical protein